MPAAILFLVANHLCCLFTGSLASLCLFLLLRINPVRHEGDIASRTCFAMKDICRIRMFAMKDSHHLPSPLSLSLDFLAPTTAMGSDLCVILSHGNFSDSLQRT